MESQEAGEDYKKQMNHVNTNLKQVYAEYKTMFDLYEDNEENRCTYTKNIVLSSIKTFNTLYSMENRLLEVTSLPSLIYQDPADKFKDIESRIAGKSNMFQQLTTLSAPLGKLFKDQPLEEYLTYEAKKKNDELVSIKNSENDDYLVITASSGERDLQFLIDFLKKFQGREFGRRSISSTASDSDLETSMEESKKEDQKKEEPKKEENVGKEAKEEKPVDSDDKRLTELITNPLNRKFILETLGTNKDQIQGANEIKLASKVFDQLVDLLVKMLEGKVQIK